MDTRLQEIQDAYFDIPFENSAYQNLAFVTASQITPERAYRAVGLRITAKLRALNETLFAQRKLAVDLQEIQHKLNQPRLNRFERMRLEIEREEKQSHDWFTRKLIRDAEVEVDTLYKVFVAMPKYSREDFEAGEITHFRERLLRQAQGLSGPTESLVNMDSDLPALANGGFGSTNLSATATQQLLERK